MPRRVKVDGDLFHGQVPDGAVYVGRQAPGLRKSPYANPFPVKTYGLAESLLRYRLHIEGFDMATLERDLTGKRPRLLVPAQPAMPRGCAAGASQPMTTTEQSNQDRANATEWLERELRFYLHKVNPTQQMQDTDADVTRMWKVYADVAPMSDIYAAVARILLTTAPVEQIQAAAADVAAAVCGCHDTHHTHGA
jgi:hypothetical protein